MLKKSVFLSLTVLLALAIAICPTAVQAQGQNAQAEQIKSKVAKLGVGEKAKATITLKDGKKIKGYIARAGDDDFVVRDRKTDAAMTVLYSEVAGVERNGGHSTAKHVAIGVGIGVGAFVTALLIIFAHLD